MDKAKAEAEGLGFSSLAVGLNREAAKQALPGFMSGKTLGANQIKFLNLIIDHLTGHGAMEVRFLYDSPSTDYSPCEVDGVFESSEVDELVSVLDDVRKRVVGIESFSGAWQDALSSDERVHERPLIDAGQE